MTERLTNIRVKNLKPKSLRYKIFDYLGKGLHIVIQPTGNKSWYMKYRIAGKEKSLFLGRYPELSVKEARELCHDEHKKTSKGIDVSKERVLERQRIMLSASEAKSKSFKDICNAWVEQKKKSNEQKGKEAHGRLNKYVYPIFNDIPITEIKTYMLEDCCKEIRDEHGYYETARKTRQDFINICMYAVKRDYIENNIARDIDYLERIKEVESHPAITDKRKINEFGEVIRKLYTSKENIVLATAIKLLPHVFARPSELRRMKWSDIDFTHAEWTYRITKVTNGFTQKIDRIVPLSPQVMSLIRELYKETGNFEYCFPANTKTGFINKKHLSDAVDCVGIDRRVQSIHGFRASFRTFSDEVLKWRPEIARQQMGHKVFDKNGRAYNRTLFLSERINMMNEWSNWLDKIRMKAEDNYFVTRRNQKSYRDVATDSP